MRTTLTLAPDVAAEVERRRREHDRSLKEEIDHLLRLGLLHADEERAGGAAEFQTRPASLGRVLVGTVDDVTAALELGEGDAAR